MSQQPPPPSSSRQQLNIDQAAIASSQVGQAGGDLVQNQGSGNVFKDVMINVFNEVGSGKTSARQDYRNRQALLSKVKNYWVKGVLETSLRDRSFINLSLEARPDAVIAPWNAVELWEEEQAPLANQTTVPELFEQLGAGRSLLILGEPGSGKTTTLLALTQHLVAQAEQDINQLIPVIFNLSSWACKKQTIASWLVTELSSKYQVPKAVGERWVKDQQLLLLLDGLDEVQLQDRETCVEALNSFHQECGPEIVVCSRLKDYEALSGRLGFQAAIYLRSLTADQVCHSLDDATSNLEGLKTLIRNDPTLHELAKSPLMLNIMAMAYRGVSAEDLPQTEIVEERQHQLLDAYIERMFKRRAGSHYTKADTLRWLSWLAQNMAQFSQTVFLIEGIHPDWLENASQRRAYRIGTKFLLLSLWSGIHAALIAGHGLDKFSFDPLQGLAGLAAGLLGSLTYGIIGGLLGGTVNASTKATTASIINGLLLGAIYGPIFGWLRQELTYGIAYALIYGLIGVLIYHPIHDERGIETVDKIRWSWPKALRYSGFGLLIGIALKLGTMTNLIPGLLIGVMITLIFGFERSKEVDRNITPNQGVWKSLANARKLFLTVGIISGLLIGLADSSLSSGNFFNPASGLINGIILGLAAALIGGQGAGIHSIKHLALRCVLWRNQRIPWNYARFLNEASDRILLQKVGGGYVFIHRALLEHLASKNASTQQ